MAFATQLLRIVWHDLAVVVFHSAGQAWLLLPQQNAAYMIAWAEHLRHDLNQS
jgi:hypothetical protein